MVTVEGRAEFFIGPRGEEGGFLTVLGRINVQELHQQVWYGGENIDVGIWKSGGAHLRVAIRFCCLFGIVVLLALHSSSSAFSDSK